MAKPKLIVISAPSGAGKTSIARAILAKHTDIVFSISATTRNKRCEEVDGRDYFFLTKEDFEQKIRKDELVEWEKIYTDYYGSLKSQVDSAMTSSRSILFDIDVKGALSIKKKYPKDSVLIFVAPPDIETLTRRLTNRKTESAETLQLRLERVSMEMTMLDKFDYCVVNEDFEKAVAEVNEIIEKAVNA